MKKFYVRDADGEEYEVEEVEELDEGNNKVTEPALTADEIAALKKLAEVADRLIATVETAEEEPVADKKDKKTEKKTEEVIETKTNDSMRSFGAIETKKVVDEAIDNDVDDAWTKRYGG